MKLRIRPAEPRDDAAIARLNERLKAAGRDATCAMDWRRGYLGSDETVAADLGWTIYPQTQAELAVVPVPLSTVTGDRDDLVAMREEGVEVRVYHPLTLRHPSWIFRRMFQDAHESASARFMAFDPNLLVPDAVDYFVVPEGNGSSLADHLDAQTERPASPGRRGGRRRRSRPAW